MPRMPTVPSGPTLDPITRIYSFLPNRRVPSDHREEAPGKSCPLNTQIFPSFLPSAVGPGGEVRQDCKTRALIFFSFVQGPLRGQSMPFATTSKAPSPTAAAHRPRQPDPSVMPPPHQLTFMLGDHVSYVKLSPPQATFYFA